MSDFKRIPVRLSYYNQEHIKILNVLDDLNLDVHKSRNQFIINAISFYINSIETNNLTYSEVDKQKELERKFVTQDQMKVIMDRFKEDVRTELYQEMIRFLAGVAFLPGESGNMCAEMVRREPHKDMSYPTEDVYDSEEDVVEKLSHYDNILQNVMDRSDD